MGGTLHSQSRCLQRDKIKLRGPLLALSSRIQHVLGLHIPRGPGTDQQNQTGACVRDGMVLGGEMMWEAKRQRAEVTYGR